MGGARVVNKGGPWPGAVGQEELWRPGVKARWACVILGEHLAVDLLEVKGSGVAVGVSISGEVAGKEDGGGAVYIGMQTTGGTCSRQ